MDTKIVPYIEMPKMKNYNSERVLSIEMNTNKKTGVQYCFVSTDTGSTYVFKMSPNGVKMKSHIEVPDWDTKKERNKIIIDLYQEGYTQSETACFMKLSQSTVSKIITRWKGKN